MVDGIYTTTFQTPNIADNLLFITDEVNKKYVHFKIDESANDIIFGITYPSQTDTNFKIRDLLLNLLHTVQGQHLFDNIYKLDLSFLSTPDSYIIEFGNAENIEVKFNKLKIFYKEGLGHHKWSNYRKINLRYKNQIVCTKY